jgi:hypothetical protein
LSAQRRFINSCGFFLSLLAILGTFSPSALATPREREVTETLLREGYTFPQSTISSLLQMIKKGETWDSSDRWMPYHNLERFMPYSEETSSRILNFIYEAVVSQNSNVEINRLLIGLYDNAIHSTEYIEKLSEVMRFLPPSEAKRLTAVMLSRFAAKRTEAVQCLESLMSFFSDKPLLQILTAYNLLVLHEHVADAESALINNLQHQETADVVFLYARGSFGAYVSDRVVNEMKRKNWPGTERSLATILEQRKPDIATSAAKCSKVLNENVIAFRPRK